MRLDRPILSIVTLTRNDNYNSDGLLRLHRSVEGYVSCSKNLREKSLEVLIVDYLSTSPIKNEIRIISSNTVEVKIVSVTKVDFGANSGDPDKLNMGHAQNIGINLASGKFVAVAAYDLLHTNYALKTLVDLLDCDMGPFDPHTSILLTPRIRVPQYVIQSQFTYSELNSLMLGSNSSAARINCCLPVGSGGGMIIASDYVWQVLNGLDERFEGWGYHDNDLVIRASRRFQIIDLGHFGILSFKPDYDPSGARSKLMLNRRRLNPRWVNVAMNAFKRRSNDTVNDFVVAVDSVPLFDNRTDITEHSDDSSSFLNEQVLAGVDKAVNSDVFDIVIQDSVPTVFHHFIKVARIFVPLRAISSLTTLNPVLSVIFFGISPSSFVLEVVSKSLYFSHLSVVEPSSSSSVGTSEIFVDKFTWIQEKGIFKGPLTGYSGKIEDFNPTLLSFMNKYNSHGLVVDTDTAAASLYLREAHFVDLVCHVATKWLFVYGLRQDTFAELLMKVQQFLSYRKGRGTYCSSSLGFGCAVFLFH